MQPRICASSILRLVFAGQEHVLENDSKVEFVYAYFGHSLLGGAEDCIEDWAFVGGGDKEAQ